MLYFLFPVYASAGVKEATAPTGGLQEDVSLKKANPACGFEWRAYTAAFYRVQGAIALIFQVAPARDRGVLPPRNGPQAPCDQESR